MVVRLQLATLDVVSVILFVKILSLARDRV